MTRAPTNRFAAWSWWRDALMGLKPETFLDAPQCGLFKTRAFGRWVAASIDLEQSIDDATGELIADETLICIVGGRVRDAHDQWPYLCGHPIGEAEHARLIATQGRIARVTDLSETVVT